MPARRGKKLARAAAAQRRRASSGSSSKPRSVRTRTNWQRKLTSSLTVLNETFLADMATAITGTTRTWSTVSSLWDSMSRLLYQRSNTLGSTRWMGRTTNWKRLIWATSQRGCSTRRDRMCAPPHFALSKSWAAANCLRVGHAFSDAYGVGSFV